MYNKRCVSEKRVKLGSIEKVTYAYFRHMCSHTHTILMNWSVFWFMIPVRSSKSKSDTQHTQMTNKM